MNPGKIISDGDFEPALARNAMTVVGKSCIELMFIIKNIIMFFVIFVLFSPMSEVAFIPIEVAAPPIPMKFAVKFIPIIVRASSLSPLNTLFVNGDSNFENFFSTPLSAIIFIKPVHNEYIAMSFMVNLTASALPSSIKDIALSGESIQIIIIDAIINMVKIMFIIVFYSETYRTMTESMLNRLLKKSLCCKISMQRFEVLKGCVLDFCVCKKTKGETLMITLSELLKNEYSKIVLSNPVKGALYKKIVVKSLVGAKTKYQAEQYTQTQVMHCNLDDVEEFVVSNAPFFKEIYLFGEVSFSAFLKNGNVTLAKKIKNETASPSTHNKEKNYIIKEGMNLEIFVKLGIFTKDYKVVQSKQDKFRQINRYLEMLDDILKDYHDGDNISIVDFGCGKSYLSFAVYYYLTEIKKLNVKMTGVDLKSDVISNCERLAKEYGYDGMNFIAGNINDFKADGDIDLVISLHACDVATDYVLKQAVENNAKHIFSVPCCQHEVNKQISHDYEPLILRYGILQERVSAIITDAVRCTLLELNNYKVDLLEFVDLSDSPKNLLIRASKANHAPSYLRKKREELNDLLQRASVEPTCFKLLLK